MDIQEEQLLRYVAYGYGVMHGRDGVECTRFAQAVVEDLRQVVDEHGTQKADEVCKWCGYNRFSHVVLACKGASLRHIFQRVEAQKYAC